MIQQYNTPSKVPLIDNNADLDNPTPEQRKFYYYWLNEFSKGNFVDIEGHVAYVIIYLDVIRKKFMLDKNLNHFLECLDKINEGYKHYDELNLYFYSWKSDAYLYLNNYEKAWFFLQFSDFISVSDVINIRNKCKDTSVIETDIYKIVNKRKSGLTKFGFENTKLVLENVSKYLAEFYKKHNKNFIEHFCQRFNFQNLTDDDFALLSESFTGDKRFSYLQLLYKVDEKNIYKESIKHNLKYNFLRCSRSLFYSRDFIVWDFIPSVIIIAIENEIKRILRECENVVREKMGISKIGEGWVSETELFNKLRKYFPVEKMIKHGKPNWLAPQHLDIYFPYRNVGVEYQGKQHQEPVEYFGGQKNFEKQQMLDERKRKLCSENGCKLVYVFENYKFEEIINKIKFLFETR